MWYLFLIWCFCSPILGEQDRNDRSPDDLLLAAGLLGEDESPPISSEIGTQILGTGAVEPINPATTILCHRRLYSYSVTKTDSAGRKCTDTVNLLSCWGRCDSNEIPDWRFPYKVSHHPVCLFGKKQEKVHILQNCDPEVEPGTERYHYQEAETCICSVCKSSETSCEGLRYRGVRSGFLAQKRRR